MVNIAIILGNLGKDAETVNTKSGAPMLKFSVCTNYRRHRDEENIATWHNVLAFGRMAEHFEKLRKGDLVQVVGERTPSAYVNSEGATVKTEDIVALSIKLVISRDKAQEQQRDYGPRERREQPAAADDLPF
jgi:single-strand DNA-binding protein